MEFKNKFHNKNYLILKYVQVLWNFIISVNHNWDYLAIYNKFSMFYNNQKVKKKDFM